MLCAIAQAYMRSRRVALSARLLVALRTDVGVGKLCPEVYYVLTRRSCNGIVHLGDTNRSWFSHGV